MTIIADLTSSSGVEVVTGAMFGVVVASRFKCEISETLSCTVPSSVQERVSVVSQRMHVYYLEPGDPPGAVRFSDHFLLPVPESTENRPFE